MTKKPSEKNKTWEKDRRDRLNKSFDKLLKLLPNYDPSITWSKIEIIQKSIDHIEDLHKKHEEYLKSKDPLILNEYADFLESLQYYRVRNNQLAEILKKAKIKLPSFDLPKLLKENSKILDQENEIFQLKKNSEHFNQTKDDQSKDLHKNTSTKTKRKPKLANEINFENKKTLNGPANENNNLNEYIPNQKESCLSKNNGCNVSTGVLIPVNIIPLQQSVQNSSLVHPPINQSSEIPSLIKLKNVGLSSKSIKSGIKSSGKQKILPQPYLKIYYRRSDGKIPIPILKRRIIQKPKFKRKRKSKIKLTTPALKGIELNKNVTNNTKDKISEEKNRTVSPTAAFLMTFPVVSSSNGKHVHAENLENFNNFFTTKEYTSYCDQNKKDKNTVINEKIDAIQTGTSNALSTSYLHTPTTTSALSDAKTSFYHLPKTISTQGLAPICTPLPLDTKTTSSSNSQLSLDTKKHVTYSDMPVQNLVPPIVSNRTNLSNDQNLNLVKSYTSPNPSFYSLSELGSNWITKFITSSTTNKNTNVIGNHMLTHQYKKTNEAVEETKKIDALNIKEDQKPDNSKTNDSYNLPTSISNANKNKANTNNKRAFNTIASQVFGMNCDHITTTSAIQSSLPALGGSWSSNKNLSASANHIASSIPTFTNTIQGNVPVTTVKSSAAKVKTSKKNSFKLDFLSNTSDMPLSKYNYSTTTSNQFVSMNNYAQFDSNLISSRETSNITRHLGLNNTTDNITKKGLTNSTSNVEYSKSIDESNSYSDLFSINTTNTKTLGTDKSTKPITNSLSSVEISSSGPFLNTLGTQNNNFYYPLQAQQSATTFSFNLSTQTNKPKQAKTQTKPLVSYTSIKTDVPWIQPPLPTTNGPITTSDYKSSFTFSLTPSTNILSTSNSCQVNDTKVSKSIPNSRTSATSEPYSTTSFTFSLTTPRPLDPIYVGSSNRCDIYPSTQLQPKLWEEQPTATNFTFALTKTSQSKNVSVTSNTDTKSKLFSTPFYDCEQLKNTKSSQKTHGHVNWMTSSTPAETHTDFSSSVIGSSSFGHYPNANREFGFSKKDSHLTQTTDDNQFLTWSPNKINHVQESNNNSGCYSSNVGGEYNYNSTQQNKETRGNSTGNFFSVSQLVEHSSTIPATDITDFNIDAISNKFKPTSKSKDHNQKKDQYLKQAISNSNYSAEALISKKEKHRNLASMHNANANYYNHTNNVYNSNFQSTDQNYNTGNYLYNYPGTNQNYMTTTDGTDYLDTSTTTYTNNDMLSYGKEKKCSLFPPLPAANGAQSYDATMNLFPVPLIPSGNHSTNTSEHYDSSGIHHYVAPQYSTNYQSTTNWTTPKSSNPSSIVGYHQANPSALTYGNAIEPNTANQNVSANLPNFNLSSICPEINDKVDTHVW